jgi:penicillin-binding protein 1C
LAGVYAFYAQDLPSAEEIGRRSVESFETTRLYDRTGKVVLYEIIPPNAGRRTEVPLADIPVYLRNATIAMEDKTFYTNPVGINVGGFLRAAWGVISGEYAGGGSSIPQQLIRNVVMTPEERMQRSYVRKIKEMILAYELTRRYPGVEGRDKILEWYLNNIFYGHFAYGIEAAAQTYFNTHVRDLTLAEATMLVPLGNAPALNPIDNPTEAKKRQEIVLDTMYSQGYITAKEALEAKRQPLAVAPARFDIVAPHYVLYVRQLLEEKYGSDAVYGGGLQVTTALDLQAQEKAQTVANEHVDKIREKYKARNAAVVILDAKTAEIKAIVGSLDYFDQTIDGQVNMALSPRQPGSSFKPFVYAQAFSQGFTPATMVMDVRLGFLGQDRPAPYVPENYSRKFSGPILLRTALACSLNVPAVTVADKVGIENVVETARAMGITTLNETNYGLSLALGGSEVTLLDMTYAFSVLANGGTMLGDPVSPERFQPGLRRLDPVAILKATDAKGHVLYEYKQPQRQEVLRPEVAFLLTDILSDNKARMSTFGPDSALKLKNRPAAVKTGTTDDYHDGWTIGYTPQYVVGVWVGNSDYDRMEGAPGVRTAGPIWNALMEWLHDGLPVENFPRPAGLETAIVDSVSGKLPTQYSPQRMQEIFIKGTAPTDPDDVHRPFRICRQSGKLATTYCPPEQVEEKVFDIYPPEADDWVREQNIPQPPAEFCDIHGPNLAAADVAITSPKLFSAVRGLVPIVGNARPGGMQKYWVQFGQGMTPSSWANLGPEHGNGVNNNVLEYWDTLGLDGLYTLQLNVLAGGNLRLASMPVVVDNISPTVKLLAPEVEQVYLFPKDEWISIQVDAQDNVAMDRVECYLDDQLLGYTTVSPYSMRWTLSMTTTMTETHSIFVVAYDTAGNVAKSEPVKVFVVPEPKENEPGHTSFLPVWRRREG